MKQKIIVTISQAGSPAARTLAYKITIDGAEVASRVLTPIESQQVAEMGAQYHSLFKGSSKTKAKDYLPILGDGLFRLFLETGWQDFGPKILQGGDLVIDSDIPEALELPWEFVRISKGDFIGVSELFNICRHPKIAHERPFQPSNPSNGPLRVLFVASEALDYEEEERGLLKAAEGLDIVLEIGDQGTLEELKELACKFRPHLVHLVTEGKMINGEARISFQSLDGKHNRLSAIQLASALDGSGANCIILGGRQSEETTSIERFCKESVEHVPLAISWTVSSGSSRSFYQRLASGGSVNDALKIARQEIFKVSMDNSELFSLPVLYAAAKLPCIFNPQKTEATNSVHRNQSPLPGMVEGYAEDYVDRRKDILRLVPALVEGRVRTLILIGKDGLGKSALATNLAANLAPHGYSILPIYSSKHNPVSMARLIDAVHGLLGRKGQFESAQSLMNGPIKKRMIGLAKALKENRFLLIWDGLDLDKETGKIPDAELAEFYLQMLSSSGSSRLVITCKALPADLLTLPPRAWEWQTSGLSEAAFIKYLLLDESLSERYRLGDITYKELQENYFAINSSLAGPAQIRQALKMEKSVTDNEVVSSISDSLNQESRLALMRFAAYDVAVSISGIATLAGTSEDKALSLAKSWQKTSLAYPIGTLWAVPSIARRRLLSCLSPQERSSSHALAGDFLKGIAESKHSEKLGLSRLDLMLEARGSYLEAEDLKEARSVTDRISGYLERRGYHSEMIRINQELLEKELHPLPMNWIARAYQNQGDFGKAIEFYDRAIQIGPDASAFHGLGTIYLSSGKHDLARANLQKAMDIWQSEEDLGNEAAALQSLASLDLLQKDVDAAHKKLKIVSEIQKKLGDLRGLAATLQEKAMIDLSRQDHESALQNLMESVEILQKTGDKIGQANVHYNIGNLKMDEGEYQPARDNFEKALVIWQNTGNKSGEAAVRHGLGLIESQAGAKDKALENFKKALQIYQEIADKPGEAGAFFQLGAVAVQSDKIKEGLRLMALSALILRSIKSEEVKNVEPLVERLASQLGFSQDQFMKMVQEVTIVYRKDKGWGLLQKAFPENR